jgi:hypothetical protein
VTEKDLISKEEVRKVFNRKIKPRMAGLEVARSKAIRNIALACICLVALSVVLFMVLPDFGDVGQKFTYFVVGTCFACYGLFHLFMFGYVLKFKTEVISEVFKALISNCSFDQFNFVSSSHVDKSGLVSTDYNHFKGEDFVKGKLGDLEVEFSELYMAKITGTGKKRREVKIFKGLFFHFTLSRNLGHSTLICRDVGEALLGKSIGRFLQKKSAKTGYELVQLESIEFEKKYSVYSNNQIKARVLLSPSVMEGLTQFNKKYKESVEISIQGSHLYVAIRSDVDHFEPQMFGEVVSIKDLREIYDLILLVRDLQEELELDQAS